MYLSRREEDVLQQIVNGYNQEAISRRLGVSGKTVKKHTVSIMSKLNCDSSAAIMSCDYVKCGCY